MGKWIAAAAVSAAIAYGTVTCPLHDMEMWATGRIQFSSWGKQMSEYRCPMGHTSWIVE